MLPSSCAEPEHYGFGCQVSKKKMKQKSFAAGVDRGVIEEGAQLLGMDLSEVIEETIRGMQNAAADLGLKGEL